MSVKRWVWGQSRGGSKVNQGVDQGSMKEMFIVSQEVGQGSIKGWFKG